MRRFISNIIIIFILSPYAVWSQDLEMSSPSGYGYGFSPSPDLATMTCPFTDAKEMQFKDDNQLLLQMKALEAKLKEKDQQSSSCSKAVGSSIGILTSGLISLKNAKDKNRQKNLTDNVLMADPSSQTVNQSSPVPMTGTSPDPMTGPGPVPPPIEDCVKNPRLCVSAFETISKAIRTKECKAQAGDLLNVLTEVSLKLAGTTGSVAILGVTAVSTIARTTLDLISDAKLSKAIKYADKINFDGQKEKLKQLSSCFAFSLYEDISCRQYGVHISKEDPSLDKVKVILGENKNNPIIDKIMIGSNGVMFREPIDQLTPEIVELMEKLNTTIFESSVIKQSREIERVEASVEFEKIMTYASSYLEEKIEEGMEHLKEARERYDEFYKKINKEKYKKAQISKIGFDPSPLVYQNLIRNCYNGRAFLVKKGDLDGQLNWSEKCGKLDECIDKIHNITFPKMVGQDQIKDLVRFVQKDILPGETEGKSLDFIKQHCISIFPPENDVFSYKSFNMPSFGGDEVMDQQSQCHGTKKTFDAVNNSFKMSSLANILKLVKFDDKGNCETGSAKMIGYLPAEDSLDDASKEMIIRCKSWLVDIKKEKDPVKDGKDKGTKVGRGQSN